MGVSLEALAMAGADCEEVPAEWEEEETPPYLLLANVLDKEYDSNSVCRVSPETLAMASVNCEDALVEGEEETPPYLFAADPDKGDDGGAGRACSSRASAGTMGWASLQALAMADADGKDVRADAAEWEGGEGRGGDASTPRRQPRERRWCNGSTVGISSLPDRTIKEHLRIWARDVASLTLLQLGKQTKTGMDRKSCPPLLSP